ncbi:unnamed protein product [Rotaria magnacalcarata]|uniref:Acyl-coenzyme A:6-aminopenicillanic acid acyl-transferase n=2 Tax=Rotaria magnacalcarata TaxID=392030 RepID=A0A820G0T2_9BILA|nr:unnamed protein product [Rotaria magnacalcarata]CAF4271151.1 unnamed protein product [Rotaria magnacalcarata]
MLDRSRLYYCLIGLFLFTQTSSCHRVNAIKNVGAFCANDTSKGDPNLNPIDKGEPKLINKVQNGTLYQIGSGDDQIYLIHVYGNSGYDFGYAYGTLLRDEVNKVLPRAWQYFEQQIIDSLKDLKLPKWFEDIIADQGLAFALDLQNELVKKYIDEEIYHEMQGVADGAQIDFKTVVRLHMLGEITRGRCSLYGLWGNATLGGKTLQLRALDWDVDAGLQDYPVVTIYHPGTSKLGHPFANVAWAGYIGTLTGMSSQRLGISEIGVSYPDDTFGDESMSGLPFIFVERYILQYSDTIDDALSFIADVKRTCHLILGVADGNLGTARMIQYSHSKVNFFDDQNLQPLADWHPRIPNAIYSGMDWLCPSRQFKLYTAITEQYGQITPESSIKNITAYVKTGDLHVGVYDLTDNVMYVANARGTNEQGPLEAYKRQFVRVDLNIEFARQR